MRAKDMKGRKFGMLTVLSRDGTAKNGNARWLCQCDCGNQKTFNGNNLRAKGNTVTCGCKHSTQLKHGEASFNALFSNYIRGALARGYAFKLSQKEFRDLTVMPCHYCGTDPASKILKPGANGEYIYNGLDRVDNTVGYTTDNVVPCCGTCNTMKMTLSKDTFLSHIQRIIKHTNGGR